MECHTLGYSEKKPVCEMGDEVHDGWKSEIGHVGASFPSAEICGKNVQNIYVHIYEIHIWTSM